MKKLCGSKLKINSRVYEISNNLQNVFSDTSDKSLKKLDDVDRVQNRNMLKSPIYDSYKPGPGETK